jgi:CBS domain-containing protein
MTVASIVAGKVAALRAGGNGEVRTVKPDITVAEAIRRMRDELVGALVVSENGASILVPPSGSCDSALLEGAMVV